MVRTPRIGTQTSIWAISFVALLSMVGAALPQYTHAATVLSSNTIAVSSSTPDNAYIAAEQVNVNVPLPADLCAVGGTITVAAPIQGDALLAGGTVDLQKPVAGDVRILGGRVSVNDIVGGDLVAGGGIVDVSGRAKNTLIGGGTVNMMNGSNGPVTIYGIDVTLSGEFDGDVQVIASDHLSLTNGTIIHGTLKYNAPQQADIPATAVIDHPVTYIGAAPYLPTVQQAKTFATAGLWVFFLVQLTAALVVTGLIAGLFPAFTDRVIETAFTRRPERYILLTLLGFAAFVATPVLIVFLLISFVGIGLALILLTLYILFLLISYVYAAVYAGSIFMYFIHRRKKETSWKITWRGALIGVIILYVLGFIPYFGMVVKVLLSAAAAGSILTLFYTFAFRRYSFKLDDE